MDKRVCTGCKVEKPVSEFYTNRRNDRTPLPTTRCRPCHNAACKRWNANNPDKRSAMYRSWRLRNLGKATLIQRRAKLKREYGLTVEQYAALVAAQDGRCAICGGPPRLQRKLAIDHDHTTGAVRGLLCGPCNVGIGALGDTAEGVERAVRYLRAADRARDRRLA